MEKMEEIFNSFNTDGGIMIQKGFIKHLLNLSEHIECDDEVKKIFFRSRMYFRIRHLNKEMFDVNVKKRKIKKTVT